MSLNDANGNSLSDQWAFTILESEVQLFKLLYRKSYAVRFF